MGWINHTLNCSWRNFEDKSNHCYRPVLLLLLLVRGHYIIHECMYTRALWQWIKLIPLIALNAQDGWMSGWVDVWIGVSNSPCWTFDQCMIYYNMTWFQLASLKRRTTTSLDVCIDIHTQVGVDGGCAQSQICLMMQILWIALSVNHNPVVLPSRRRRRPKNNIIYCPDPKELVRQGTEFSQPAKRG